MFCIGARNGQPKWSEPSATNGMGDATTVPCKQIIIAMCEAAKASLSAFDHLIRASVPM